MTRKFALLFFVFPALFSSCKNGTSINQDDAAEVIKAHLDSNPEYKTTTFRYGELKFHNRKDREDLAKYRELADKGLIKMDLDERKKVFLSKTDTTYVYQVTLTDRAASLVLEQNKNRATVKAINYTLDGAKPVNFEKSNEKTAKATISLKKEPTDFYPFMGKDSSSDFITKTYKLRFKDDTGWEIN